jgi:CTP:molybdopterin cytidylyltransferase MocA
MGERSLVGVILAGHSPQEDDPLAAYTQGHSKALIPIAGRPMIAYVVDALERSRYIRQIVVIGLPPEEHDLLPPAIDHLPDQGSLFANAQAGVRYALSLPAATDGVLVSGSDVPLITAEIVDRFIDTCLETDDDFYYGIIERSVMEGRFPASHRTYVRLLDGEFAGGDVSLVRSDIMADPALWERVAAARKSPLKQARLVGGIGPLFKLLLHRLSLAEAERIAERAFNIRGRVIVCADAELGMDIDKPFQLEIARAELEARQGGATC